MLLLVVGMQDLALAAGGAMPAAGEASARGFHGFDIPASVASVETHHRFDAADSGEKRILLIRDAHTNVSGQVNLAKTLEALAAQMPMPIVFTEGADGDVSLSHLRGRAEPETARRVTMGFLRKGEIKGSEYAQITGEKDFAIVGVEENRLYDRSLEIYRRTVQNREAASTHLARIGVTARFVAFKTLSPDARGFLAKREALQRGRISWMEYLEALTASALANGVALADYGRLERLSRIRGMEKKIDFDAIRRDWERSGLRGPDGAASNLETLLEQSAFGLRIKESIRHLDRSEWRVYLRYLDAVRRLRPQDLARDQRELESALAERLGATADERRLIRLFDALTALDALSQMRLTPDERARFKADPDAHDPVRITAFLNRLLAERGIAPERALFLDVAVAKHLERAMRFYELADQRDRVFVRRLLKKMDETGVVNGVLITGGYHTDHLTRLLLARNVPFAVLTPQVYEPTDQARYEQLLLAPSESALISRYAVQTSAAARLAGALEPDGTRAFKVSRLGERILKALADPALPDGRIRLHKLKETVRAGASEVFSDQDFEESIRRLKRSRQILTIGGMEILPTTQLTLRSDASTLDSDRDGARMAGFQLDRQMDQLERWMQADGRRSFRAYTQSYDSIRIGTSPGSRRILEKNISDILHKNTGSPRASLHALALRTMSVLPQAAGGSEEAGRQYLSRLERLCRTYNGWLERVPADEKGRGLQAPLSVPVLLMESLAAFYTNPAAIQEMESLSGRLIHAGDRVVAMHLFSIGAHFEYKIFEGDEPDLKAILPSVEYAIGRLQKPFKNESDRLALQVGLVKFLQGARPLLEPATKEVEALFADNADLRELRKLVRRNQNPIRAWKGEIETLDATYGVTVSTFGWKFIQRFLEVMPQWRDESGRLLAADEVLLNPYRYAHLLRPFLAQIAGQDEFAADWNHVVFRGDLEKLGVPASAGGVRMAQNWMRRMIKKLSKQGPVPSEKIPVVHRPGEDIVRLYRRSLAGEFARSVGVEMVLVSTRLNLAADQSRISSVRAQFPELGRRAYELGMRLRQRQAPNLSSDDPAVESWISEARELFAELPFIQRVSPVNEPNLYRLMQILRFGNRSPQDLATDLAVSSNQPADALALIFYLSARLDLFYLSEDDRAFRLREDPELPILHRNLEILAKSSHPLSESAYPAVIRKLRAVDAYYDGIGRTSPGRETYADLWHWLASLDLSGARMASAGDEDGERDWGRHYAELQQEILNAIRGAQSYLGEWQMEEYEPVLFGWINAVESDTPEAAIRYVQLIARMLEDNCITLDDLEWMREVAIEPGLTGYLDMDKKRYSLLQTIRSVFDAGDISRQVFRDDLKERMTSIIENREDYLDAVNELLTHGNAWPDVLAHMDRVMSLSQRSIRELGMVYAPTVLSDHLRLLRLDMGNLRVLRDRYLRLLESDIRFVAVNVDTLRNLHIQYETYKLPGAPPDHSNREIRRLLTPFLDLTANAKEFDGILKGVYQAVKGGWSTEDIHRILLPMVRNISVKETSARWASNVARALAFKLHETSDQEWIYLPLSRILGHHFYDLVFEWSSDSIASVASNPHIVAFKGRFDHRKSEDEPYDEIDLVDSLAMPLLRAASENLAKKLDSPDLTDTEERGRLIRLRRWVMNKLTEIHNTSEIAAVKFFTTYPDLAQQRMLIRRFGRYRDPRSRKALGDALNLPLPEGMDMADGIDLKLAILSELLRIGHPESVSAVKKFMTHPMISEDTSGLLVRYAQETIDNLRSLRSDPASSSAAPAGETDLGTRMAAADSSSDSSSSVDWPFAALQTGNQVDAARGQLTFDGDLVPGAPGRPTKRQGVKMLREATQESEEKIYPHLLLFLNHLQGYMDGTNRTAENLDAIRLLYGEISASVESWTREKSPFRNTRGAQSWRHLFDLITDYLDKHGLRREMVKAAPKPSDTEEGSASANLDAADPAPPAVLRSRLELEMLRLLRSSGTSLSTRDIKEDLLRQGALIASLSLGRQANRLADANLVTKTEGAHRQSANAYGLAEGGRRLLEFYDKHPDQVARIKRQADRIPDSEEGARMADPSPEAARQIQVWKERKETARVIRRILINEDNPVSLELILARLERHPRTADAVATAEIRSKSEEALEAFRAAVQNGTPYDLVVTDHDTKSDMTGAELIQWARYAEESAGVPRALIVYQSSNPLDAAEHLGGNFDRTSLFLIDKSNLTGDLTAILNAAALDGDGARMANADANTPTVLHRMDARRLQELSVRARYRQRIERVLDSEQGTIQDRNAEVDRLEKLQSAELDRLRQNSLPVEGSDRASSTAEPETLVVPKGGKEGSVQTVRYGLFEIRTRDEKLAEMLKILNHGGFIPEGTWEVHPRVSFDRGVVSVMTVFAPGLPARGKTLMYSVSRRFERMPVRVRFVQPSPKRKSVDIEFLVHSAITRQDFVVAKYPFIRKGRIVTGRPVLSKPWSTSPLVRELIAGIQVNDVPEALRTLTPEMATKHGENLFYLTANPQSRKVEFWSSVRLNLWPQMKRPVVTVEEFLGSDGMGWTATLWEEAGDDRPRIPIQSIFLQRNGQFTQSYAKPMLGPGFDQVVGEVPKVARHFGDNRLDTQWLTYWLANPGRNIPIRPFAVDPDMDYHYLYSLGGRTQQIPLPKSFRGPAARITPTAFPAAAQGNFRGIVLSDGHGQNLPLPLTRNGQFLQIESEYKTFRHKKSGSLFTVRVTKPRDPKAPKSVKTGMWVWVSRRVHQRGGNIYDKPVARFIVPAPLRMSAKTVARRIANKPWKGESDNVSVIRQVRRWAAHGARLSAPQTALAPFLDAVQKANPGRRGVLAVESAKLPGGDRLVRRYRLNGARFAGADVRMKQLNAGEAADEDLRIAAFAGSLGTEPVNYLIDLTRLLSKVPDANVRQQLQSRIVRLSEVIEASGLGRIVLTDRPEWSASLIPGAASVLLWDESDPGALNRIERYDLQLQYRQGENEILPILSSIVLSNVMARISRTEDPALRAQMMRDAAPLFSRLTGPGSALTDTYLRKMEKYDPGFAAHYRTIRPLQLQSYLEFEVYLQQLSRKWADRSA